MTQYNISNVKLSNSQLNKLQYGIKNNTKVILKLSSNVVGDPNHKNNLPHKSLLTLHKFQNFVKLLEIILQLI